jgi:hypothetical protein
MQGIEVGGAVDCPHLAQLNVLVPVDAAIAIRIRRFPPLIERFAYVRVGSKLRAPGLGFRRLKIGDTCHPLFQRPLAADGAAALGRERVLAALEELGDTRFRGHPPAGGGSRV